MARAPSLKPQLNQIRTWVAEGVTDIWIAHQLDVTPAQIADFRRRQGLLRPDETPAPAKARAPRAAAKPKAEKAKAEKPKAAKPKATRSKTADEPTNDADASEQTDEAGTAKRRRRGRRGGRGRGKARAQLIPATIEHGADGVVIRIDATVLESEAYREHWSAVTTAGVTVTATGFAVGATAAADAPAADDDED